MYIFVGDKKNKENNVGVIDVIDDDIAFVGPVCPIYLFAR